MALSLPRFVGSRASVDPGHAHYHLHCQDRYQRQVRD